MEKFHVICVSEGCLETKTSETLDELKQWLIDNSILEGIPSEGEVVDPVPGVSEELLQILNQWTEGVLIFDLAEALKKHCPMSMEWGNGKLIITRG